MAVTLIAHTEVGSGGASNIEFTSISSTYDDLWLQLSVRNNNSTSTGIGLRFNGDATSIYSQTTLRDEYGSTGSFRQTNQTSILIGFSTLSSFTSNTFSSLGLLIPNYKNTSYHKPIISDGVMENNSTTAFDLRFVSGLWRNTAAISSIKVEAPFGGGNSFVQYSQATLYGITKA